jgi:hypothetical protein
MPEEEAADPILTRLSTKQWRGELPQLNMEGLVKADKGSRSVHRNSKTTRAKPGVNLLGMLYLRRMMLQLGLRRAHEL